MKRSKRKGPFLSVINKSLKKNSTVTKRFINKKYNIHDGKKIVTVVVDKSMIGYKIGEFLSTRVSFKFKKK